jgi:hypothetical protein
MLRTLLELYVDFQKRVNKFEEQLSPLVTIDLDELGYFGEELLRRVRIELGMPEEDELGVFIFDYWDDLLFKVIDGEATIDDIIYDFVNWNKVFN